MISKKKKKKVQFRKFRRLRGGCFRMGGAIFHFSHKIGLKSTKSMRFCILHKPMGGLEPPLPPPPCYATATKYCIFTFWIKATRPTHQRWSPRGRPWSRGHILKSLALPSKVKSLALASRPQVLKNWPVLGSRTALFFELLKFCGALEKFFGKRFFVEIA